MVRSSALARFFRLTIDLPFSSERRGRVRAYHGREEPRARPAASRHEGSRERTGVAFDCWNGWFDSAHLRLTGSHGHSGPAFGAQHVQQPGTEHETQTDARRHLRMRNDLRYCREQGNTSHEGGWPHLFCRPISPSGAYNGYKNGNNDQGAHKYHEPLRQSIKPLLRFCRVQGSIPVCRTLGSLFR